MKTASTKFTSDSQQQLIARFRHVYTTYQENRDLIAVGAYQPGSNPQLDEAISLWPAMTEFLRQPYTECVDSAASLQGLRDLLAAETPVTPPAPDIDGS